MTGRKNLCAHIPIALHEKVSAARAEAGLNTNDYVTQVLTEYYDWKENGGNIMARKAENTRTLAFQIPEELFQRIKEHLEKESRRRGIRLTQRDFVLGLIEQALEEAEREAARTEETAAGQPDEANARYEPDADCPDAGADGEEAEADSAENAPSEAGEDGEETEADSAESAENAPADAGEDGEETEEADSAESAENALADAGEDADSGDGVRSAEWN